MPHFTKQQITEIANRLNALGAKDSQFTKIKSLSSPISIAAIQDGRNVLIPSDKLREISLKNIDVYKIPVSYDGYDAETLGDLIQAMISIIGVPHNIILANAQQIGYGVPRNIPKLGEDTVKEALDVIFNILYGINPFPTEAAEADIINIFTTTN